MKPIYLDHAAATPMLPSVKEALTALPEDLGNPSSVHQAGVSARMQIDEARQSIADYFEAGLGNVIFTSGATESLNLAVIGHYLSLENPHKRIYISPIGHSAVFGAADFLATHFGVEVVFLPTDETGLIDLEACEKCLDEPLDMVVCEYGNSEIGVLQPVAKLGKMLIKKAAEKGESKPAFIVDAAAAVVTQKISLDYQKCEAIAVSGEKIGGMSGMGILLKSDQLALSPIQKGSHEFGLRGGTENWWGITAFCEALKYLAANQETNNQKYAAFSQHLDNFIKDQVPEAKVMSPTSESVKLPHVFHFVLPPKYDKASLFVIQADLAGLQVSAGSACSSGSVGGSKALKSLNLSPEESERGIRLSFGWNTTENDILAALEILKKLL